MDRAPMVSGPSGSVDAGVAVYASLTSSRAHHPSVIPLLLVLLLPLPIPKGLRVTGKRITAVAAITLTMAAISSIPAHADASPGEQTIIVSSTADPTVTLVVTLDPDANGGAVPDDEVTAITAVLRASLDAQGAPDALTPEAASVLEADVVSPDESTPEESGAAVAMAPTRQDPGGGSAGRGALKCYDNRSWTDARGTFHARHNCAFNNINWGYTIAPSMQAVIAGPVRETGLRWWKNGKSQPANSPHTVGKSYFFHGTIGKVGSWDSIDYQDYMTFPVNVSGRPGKGTITIAGGLVPLRG
ncbi:hypothetical protein ACGF12_34265 [Kitasatospora sp. NPDC048296]|uniref:hypothetical protein n=1 Tax=Kitasatospora sp. NPDC048296 TaxID=3364048 RepID=UPI0037124CEB